MRTTTLALRLALVIPFTALVACNDMLTEHPRSTIVTDTYFQTASDAKAAIAAAYQPWSSGNLWSTNLQWGLNAATDESRVGPEEENANIVALTQLRWTPTNPYTSGSWVGLYQVVTRSNLVLEKVPGITMDATQKNYITGEAKFLRALAYHYLVRLYGDVPIVTSTDEQLASATGGRDPVEKVYALIEKDAAEAEAALPLTWPTADKGRATKGAAEALLAEHYIWKKDWANAAANAKKIIDAGTYSLRPNYLDAFLPNSQNRSEEIFAAQSSQATGAPEITIAGWTYPRNMNPNANGGWGTYQPLTWFIDSYIPGDHRKEVSLVTHGIAPNGRDTTVLPHLDLHRPTIRPGKQDVNYPMYRYDDVLLMYAEALNEQGQTAQAIGFVNQIRARARNGTGSENR